MTDVLELFNCVVVNDHQTVGAPCLTNAAVGVITDFEPGAMQTAALLESNTPINITTLFTREERETAPIEHLFVKQILHYIEVYGLNMPGLFDLEQSGGQIVTMRFVHGVTVDELAEKVKTLLYANAPIKDAAQLKRIIERYAIKYDINAVANNELRVMLYRPGVDVFTSGDDAVRALCYIATGSVLLIKSKDVIAAVKKIAMHSEFFTKHEVPLAQVFNRHKRLILAAKKKNTVTAINRIARLSKTKHVPIRESIAKTFIHKALTEVDFDAAAALNHVTVRDQFKYLNLLEQRKLQSKTASFNIRNGKVWTRGDRKVYSLESIARVEHKVLANLYVDLGHLRGSDILLDPLVDYGLPVSRKQTVGNLPFGTTVTSPGNEITSGMYWENAWGASDLDLSTIDMEGNRTGWGASSGYGHGGITFSGDITNAHSGAMEFMTSRNVDYGLFVNIYAGENGSKMELVVGSNKTKKQWIDEPIIREKHTLVSKDSVIGFVRGKTFIVYAGRLGNSRVSGDNPIINQSQVDPWTIQRLFTSLDIDFDVDRDTAIEYNHDLSYSSFSIDKLEALFE